MKGTSYFKMLTAYCLDITTGPEFQNHPYSLWTDDDLVFYVPFNII